MLNAVAARGHEIWAVGQSDDARHRGRRLIEHYAHRRWTLETPSVGSAFTNLTGVTISGRTPWAAGTYYDAAAGIQKTIIIRRDAAGWHDVRAPSPGFGDSTFRRDLSRRPRPLGHGLRQDATSRQPLIEHHRN